MSYRIKYASIGSVSSGTMATDDLLSALSSELDYQLGRQSTRFPRRELRKLIRDAERAVGDSDDEMGRDVVDELFEALEQFAPPYAYFGSIEGDGADYGYWPSVDGFDGLKVDDLADVPKGYRGEVMLVNDHGNVTIGAVNARGTFNEIWSCV